MADWQNQYRTVTTDETTALDSVGCRHVRHWEWSLNGLLVAMSPKVWHCANPQQAITDADGADIERIHLVHGPVWIPQHCDTLTVTMGHLRAAGSGSVVWRLYCASALYRDANDYDSTQQGLLYDSATIATTSSGTHAIAVSERQIDVVRDISSGWSWFSLTSTADDASSSARFTTLDVTAQASAAYV
jgi:hypothetical protein